MYTTPIFSLLILCVQLQLSTQKEVQFLQYYLSTSDDVIYNGDLANDCKLFTSDKSFQICPNPSRLTDDVTEEGQQFNSDSNKFIGWRGDFELALEFPDTFITRVDIYFYNNPRMGYGLPPLKESQYFFNGLTGDPIPIEVSFANNSHLSQSDDSVTVVSIVVSSDLIDVPYAFLRLSFDTSSTLINKTFISEVKLINGTETLPRFTDIQFSSPNQSVEYGLTNDNTVSSVELSCTVAIEGSFSFTWTRANGVIADNGSETRIFSADTTRTSILRISQLSLMDNGTYSCEATYTHTVSPATSATDTVTLILGGSVSHPNTVHAQEGDDSATLQCNFTGYFSPTINVIWRDGDGAVIEDSTDGYNITTSLSGPGLSQRGGDSVENGVTSTLTITSIEQSDLGTQYTCIMDGTNIQGNIQLIERIASPSPSPSPSSSFSLSSSSSSSPSSSLTTTSSSTSATESGSDSNLIIGGAVAGGIVFTISVLVVILVVIMLVVWYSKKRLFKNVHFSNDAIYAELQNPEPSTFSNHLIIGYKASNLDNENRNAFPMKQKRASPLPFGGTLCPARISSVPDFLQANPMYSSSENVLREYKQTQYASSLPFLDKVDESSNYENSNFKIYAQCEAPSIPSFHGTPMGSVYNEEDLDPSVFQNVPSSENEDIYQIYRSVYSNPQPLQQTETLLEVKEKNIRKLKDLGVGQFGEVELAHTVGLSLKQLRMSKSNNDPGVSLVVAVKRLKSEADETMREAFENEIKFMARLNHENVVRLLGVCLSQRAFIMMEYMEEGDLNHYLKAQEFITVDSYPLSDGTVDVAILVYICLQVASGMKYLASLKFVHRDLATRNILVGQEFKVKIADFGMSQCLNFSDYYRIKGTAVLPIRWMANECFYGQFSEKTDVWAFGVAMWEIFTLCQQKPYKAFTDQELIDDAIMGEVRTLLSRPETCPEEVYHVMLRCWVNMPEDRANFEEIYGLLSQVHGM